MNISHWVAFLGFLVIFSGCALDFTDQPLSKYEAERFKNRALEPADRSYRYAFSGQVVNELTGEAIEDFSVQPLAKSQQLSAVLNGLGGGDGLFHLSRNPSIADASKVTLPVMISAPGFAPIIQSLVVGADCRTPECVGSQPLQFFLSTLQSGSELSLPLGQFSPEAIDQQMASNSTLKIFQELIAAGKLDPQVQSLMGGSKNGDMLSNILVVLNSSGATSSESEALISDLVGSTGSATQLQGLGGLGSLSALVPMLASGSPEVAAAMLAVNLLLPYMQNAMTKIAANNNGPFAQVLSSFVQNPNMQQGMSAMISALATGNSGQAASLAMGTFLPFVSGLLTQKLDQNGSANPFSAILASALGNPQLMGLVTGQKLSKEETMAIVSPYLQNLVQGLGGKNGPLLGGLLNSLLAGENPLGTLKNFPSGNSELDRYAELIPYIEPLVAGLQGQDGDMLARFLAPMIAQNDAASALESLIQSDASTSIENQALIASSMFPAIGSVLEQYVPRKQVLAAQLMQGLSNGSLTDVRVSDDLPSAPAVVVSGRAQDIFKMVQLPNVEHVMLLDE